MSPRTIHTKSSAWPRWLLATKQRALGLWEWHGSAFAPEGTRSEEVAEEPRRVAASRRVRWAFAAMILIIYLLHAAPGAWWGDGQEFACAAWTLGIAHPTGYPLFTLLGHVWMKLLVALGMGDPGRALTWLSATELAVALGLIARLLQRVRLENPAQLAASVTCDCSMRALPPVLGMMLLLAFGNTVFEHATFAEVYPLAFLFVGIVINIAWTEEWQLSGNMLRRAAWLGIAFGLALLNHYSILALAPLALLIAFKWERRSDRPYLTLALAFGCGALMLLGYVYLLLRARANPLLNWGDPETFSRLKWVLGGGQFRDLKVTAQSGAALQGLSHWFGWWAAQWIPARYVSNNLGGVAGALLLCVAAWGLILLARRRAVLGIGLLLSIACTALFAAVYHIPDIDAYFLPALPAAAIGWLIAGQWALALVRTVSASALRQPFFRAVPLALGVVVFIGQRGSVDKSGDFAPQVWGMGALAVLPNNALILTQGDQDIYCLWYQQMVLAKRPDVTVFGSQFIFSGWYAKFFEHPGRGPAITWSEERKPGDKIDYDLALFEHILLPNLKQGTRVFTTFIDPLFQEYLSPVAANQAPLLPPSYYNQADYPYGLPSPVIYELHPNAALADLPHDALAKSFRQFYNLHLAP